MKRLPLAPDLMARVEDYARARALSVADAGADLVQAGLTARAQQARARAARWAGKPADARRAAAQAASLARWRRS